jgi:hypothetical protein
MSGISIPSASDAITAAVIRAALLRIESLRNSGNLEQAITECEAFRSRLKFFYDHAYPVGNINSAVEATSVAINAVIDPTSFSIGALSGAALWAKFDEDAVEFKFSYNDSPAIKVNSYRNLPTYTNMAASLIHLTQTVGIPVIAAANLMYTMLYPSETTKADTNYTQDFFSQLLTTVGSAAMPIMGDAVRQSIHEVYYATADLLRMLKVENEGVNFIRT